jgi:hypothetical protein
VPFRALAQIVHVLFDLDEDRIREHGPLPSRVLSWYGWAISTFAAFTVTLVR